MRLLFLLFIPFTHMIPIELRDRKCVFDRPSISETCSDSSERNLKSFGQFLNSDILPSKFNLQRLSHVPELLAVGDESDVALLVVSVYINPIHFQSGNERIFKILKESVELGIPRIVGDPSSPIMGVVRSINTVASAFHTLPHSPHSSLEGIRVLGVTSMLCNTRSGYFCAKAPASEYAPPKVGHGHFLQVAAITKAVQIPFSGFTHRKDSKPSEFLTNQGLDGSAFLTNSIFSHDSKYVFGLRLGLECDCNRVESDSFTS